MYNDDNLKDCFMELEKGRCCEDSPSMLPTEFHPIHHIFTSNIAGILYVKCTKKQKDRNDNDDNNDHHNIPLCRTSLEEYLEK